MTRPLYGPAPGGTAPRFDVAFVGGASPHRLRLAG